MGRYRVDPRYPYSGDLTSAMIRDTVTGLVVGFARADELSMSAVTTARDRAQAQADAMNAAPAPRYVVKCDDCKVAIRATDNVRESFAGGLCPRCKVAR
jgi:hypothetical protein